MRMSDSGRVLETHAQTAIPYTELLSGGWRVVYYRDQS